jgi:MFS family permease
MVKRIFGVNRNIVLLGIVSFLTDVSSEMIFAVFSVFFTIILGASTALLGLIEGLADFAASSLDYVAGYLSDKSGKRKRFAALGYGFSTLAKTILLVPSAVSAAAFRVVERLGKSFRGPPRDAWIASLTDDKTRGYSFALHKAFDKSGAILGPLIAYLLLNEYGQTGSTFTLLFKIALIPAALAVIVLLLVKDSPSKPVKKENIFESYKNLGKEFKHYFYTAGIFSLAYFSFGFLLLKAYSVGFEIKHVVLLYALFNVAFVVFAVPIGKLGDLIGLRKIILLGYATYFVMSLGFIFATTRAHVIALFVLFGIFYAIDESQSKAYITQMEQKRRGTAVGIYNFGVGLVYLPASLIAGALWKIGPGYAFGFAAAVSLAALLFFISRKRT